MALSAKNEVEKNPLQLWLPTFLSEKQFGFQCIIIMNLSDSLTNLDFLQND